MEAYSVISTFNQGQSIQVQSFKDYASANTHFQQMREMYKDMGYHEERDHNWDNYGHGCNDNKYIFKYSEDAKNNGFKEDAGIELYLSYSLRFS